MAMQDNNTLVGFIGGVLGGTGGLLTIQEGLHLGVIVVGALLGGFAGVAGKELYYYLKVKWKHWKLNK